jgi:ribosomal protein S18 acetylase RimI-like enzyme
LRNLAREYSSKLRRAYESGGALLVVTRVLEKARRALLRTSHAIWFSRDLSDPIVEIAPKVDVEIDWASEDTIDWLRQQPIFSDDDERELAVAAAQGHFLPSVRHDGEIIGFIKVGRGEVYVYDFDARLRFPDRTAFIYDTYTSPDYRGQNVAPFLVNEVVRSLGERGFERLMCHIPTWNTASIRLYTKCGFHEVKRIRFLSVLGWKLFSTRPEAL